MQLRARKRIAVVATGGTIAMEGSHDFDWLEYGSNGVMNPIEDVLARLNLELPDYELSLHNFRSLPSTNIGPADWMDLNKAFRSIIGNESSLDGLVVTHGTASLEESCYFTHLVHPGPQPIVFTGAQRPPNTASSDAHANLRSAIIGAGCEQLRSGGAFVCLDETLHSASEVTKASNFTLDAFDSPNFGPVGRLDPTGQWVIPRAPVSATAGLFSTTDLAGPLPRTDIVYSYAGADGVAIEAFVNAGARALVSVGFPPGRASNIERKALYAAVSAGLIVVQCSRALRGRVPLQTYNGAAGVLSGGSLPPSKARILTMLALANSMQPQHLQELLLKAA